METTQEIVDRLRAYKEKFADKYGIEQLVENSPTIAPLRSL